MIKLDDMCKLGWPFIQNSEYKVSDKYNIPVKIKIYPMDVYLPQFYGIMFLLLSMLSFGDH